MADFYGLRVVVQEFAVFGGKDQVSLVRVEVAGNEVFAAQGGEGGVEFFGGGFVECGDALGGVSICIAGLTYLEMFLRTSLLDGSAGECASGGRAHFRPSSALQAQGAACTDRVHGIWRIYSCMYSWQE